MGPLLPIGILMLCGAAYAKSRPGDNLYGKLTPQRNIVFDTVLTEVKDEKQLRFMADAFDKEGLHNHADLLRKRAALRELPPETQKARRDVFRRALKSTNADAVEKVAQAFHDEGATGAAQRLWSHAVGLRAAMTASAPAPTPPADPTPTPAAA